MDNAKKLMVGVIILLSIILLAALAVKYNGKGGGIFNQPNWQWSDDWNSGQIAPPPSQPGQPPTSPIQPQQPEGQVKAQNFQEAKALSQRTGKPILAIFGASWCSWCHKLERETLTDPSVKAVMMKYVYVKVDADSDRSTVNQFDVGGLPTTIITDGTKSIKRENGFMDTRKMVGFLQ